MKPNEQKKAAKEFIKRWQDRGNERSDSQPFWIDLLQNVYGISNPSEYIRFEEKVQLEHTSFIDGFIDKTKVMIEQKGKHKDLNKGIKQSDGTFLTPFQQAKRYAANLPYSKRPRWIITCNFNEFYVYDMEYPNGEATVIKLEDLATDYYRLEFLVDKENEHLEKEMHVSMKAGEIVGKIYEELREQYVDPDNEESQQSINQLCVRIVFCLYAEDANIFGKHNMFYDYLKDYEARDFRRSIIDLFKVLNTPIDERDPYLDEKLAAFPYVNGGMFANDHIEIPQFTENIRTLILENASNEFDWSDISPTIFGAVFESTLNPDTRHAGGMHYTSIENIHKVIDPLFLDALKQELNEIKTIKQPARLKKELELYQHKLTQLTFFDPACGSGNFLTETYLSIRKLENEAIKLIYGDNVLLDTEQELIKVKLDQFYGIEINDFAVSVAKTALWIAESQMMEKTKEIVYSNDNFLPLKSYTNIVEGNALTLEWTEVVPKDQLKYIIGNPPFLGAYSLNKEQKKEREEIWGKGSGVLDYVTCWYKKAADFMANTFIKAAFVSTDSISQGQQVTPLWQPLMAKGFSIDFAYKTFKWTSEAQDNAGVNVIIIGFSQNNNNKEKILFTDSSNWKIVNNINGYLIAGDNTFINKYSKPLCKVSEMAKGYQATDHGYLLLSKDEYNKIVKSNPEIKKWIRKFSMGEEFIKGIDRYCLWLTDISPKELKEISFIKNRVEKCKEWRSTQTKTGDAYKLKDTPHLFRPCKKFKDTSYIGIPSVSSENRKYIPMGFVDDGMIPGNMLYFISDANLYEFGIMQSNVHMAWTRIVCGYLGTSYRYSNTIVYNTFPWCEPTGKQKGKIEQTAQGILDARALYPDCSLADLYDETFMPSELRKAHQENDKAVMEAYGFDWRNMTESECVAALMKMYQKLVDKQQ